MKRFIKIATPVLIAVLLCAFAAPILLKTIYPLKCEEAISQSSEKYGLDKFFVMGVISAESRFFEVAVSNRNAKGLMQLKDETARWCAEKYGIEGDITDSEVNIEIGCAYLRYLLDLFDGNTKNALAAYNAGQGNVKKWLSDERYSNDGKTLDKIPYGETREYVKRVFAREKIYRSIYE